MPEDAITLLRLHPFSAELDDEALSEVAAAAEIVHLERGEVVYPANQPVQTVSFIVYGGIKQATVDSRGDEVMSVLQSRGGQVGFLLAVSGDVMPVKMTAAEPSVVLQFDYRTLDSLVNAHPALKRNLGRMLAHRFSEQLMDRHRLIPELVAFVHASPETRPVTHRVVQRLLALGESPCLFSDDPGCEADPQVRFVSLLVDGRLMPEEAVRSQVDQWSDSKRKVFDVSADRAHEVLQLVHRVCEMVFWCVTPETWEQVADTLSALNSQAQGWRQKLRLVWVLDPERQVPPVAPSLQKRVGYDFKVSLQPPTSVQGPLLLHGIERIVHELRGVRIGVALGGGGARGMAHLGVFKALEEQGIVVDMLSGTSAGALTGSLLAAGYDAEHTIRSFAKDLAPGRLFRVFPRGDTWQLLWWYRRGRFDGMLRPYLRDWRLEQFPLPIHNVSADLVQGKAVIRSEGDAVASILESINLPVLSTPRNRDGQALIDGGLINNIPADVLVDQGCTFVIAVNVTSRLGHEFAGNRPNMPTPLMKRANTLQTFLRGYLVQSVNLNAVGIEPADIVIDPDVHAFELSEFARTPELAQEGERATLAAMDQIKAKLAELDSALFGDGSWKPQA